MGRHPRLAFSRPVRRSLTLRPAYSPRRQATCFLEGFDGFVTSTAAPIATGWSDPVAGWESHPLKNQTFHGARTCTALLGWSSTPRFIPRSNPLLPRRKGRRAWIVADRAPRFAEHVLSIIHKLHFHRCCCCWSTR